MWVNNNPWLLLKTLGSNLDVKLAYLIASNLIEHHIYEELYQLKYQKNMDENPLIKWAKKPISFVEITIILINSDFFEKGNLSDVQLLSYLADFYKVNLPNPHKSVSEIKTRKGDKKRAYYELNTDFSN